MNLAKSRSSMSLRASSCMATSSESRMTTCTRKLIKVPSTKQLPSDFFGERTRKYSCISIRSTMIENMAFTFMADSPKPTCRPPHRKQPLRPSLPTSMMRQTQITKTRRRYDLKLKSPHRNFFIQAS